MCRAPGADRICWGGETRAVSELKKCGVSSGKEQETVHGISRNEAGEKVSALEIAEAVAARLGGDVNLGQALMTGLTPWRSMLRVARRGRKVIALQDEDALTHRIGPAVVVGAAAVRPTPTREMRQPNCGRSRVERTSTCCQGPRGRELSTGQAPADSWDRCRDTTAGS